MPRKTDPQELAAKLHGHERIVLQFSGGKDSLACLLLLKDHLHKIQVLWMNPDGAHALPEVLQQMGRVEAFCPNFSAVYGFSRAQIKEKGLPVDTLPVRSHVAVQWLTQRPESLILQPFLDCCMENLLAPMHAATLEFAPTLIIRGQKLSDYHKSPVRSGAVIEGVQYWFPVESWDDADVRAFIADSPLLPTTAADATRSLECPGCTAYRHESAWQLPYLEKHHPALGAQLREDLKAIRAELVDDLYYYEEVVETPALLTKQAEVFLPVKGSGATAEPTNAPAFVAFNPAAAFDLVGGALSPAAIERDCSKFARSLPSNCTCRADQPVCDCLLNIQVEEVEIGERWSWNSKKKGKE